MKKLLLIALLLYGAAANAQSGAILTDDAKHSIIDSIAAKLQRYYVFPDKAKQMAVYLKKRERHQAYKNIRDCRAFCDTLEADLQHIQHDGHMHVINDPRRVATLKQWRATPEPSADLLEKQAQEDRRANFGFVKTEILPGNIGYLDFRQFYPVNEESKSTVAAVMRFLAHTDAIIIDLRKNGGGEPEMVQYILSYFVGGKPVHYNSLYERITNHTQDFYSLDTVQGTKMPNTPLYVLTSHYTFSGAEEFAYDLKNLKRATIIGETTGGGAHPTGPYIINDQVFMTIPFARAISPFTQTNWEGTGVTPDIKAEASMALLQAQQLALQTLVPKLAANTMENVLAERSLRLLNAQLHPIPVRAEQRQAYAGTYGEHTITTDGDALYYQRGAGPKYKLLALTEDLFAIEGMDDARLQFVDVKEGRAGKLRAVFGIGQREEVARTTKTF